MRPALATVLLFTAPVLLAQTAPPKSPPGKPDPALATAGTYKVDDGHTQLLFTVNHMGFSEYTGAFVQPSGSLTLDAKTPANSKVTVTFPIDKVETTVPALDTHLKSADFFDAAKYPTATFTSTRIAVHGTSATITGNLTLKGVTKPVTLEARFIGAGPGMMEGRKTNVGFRATGSIMRSAWGIGYGVPVVSDRVDLVINAAFVHE